MKAIILAAGQGNRMKPLTKTTHKALLNVGGKTLLQNAIDCLLANHVQDIVVVLGYMADAVKQHLQHHYPNMPITYVLNERYQDTNNIVSLSLALNTISLDQDILLIECDLVFTKEIISRIIQSSWSDVALVGRYRPGMDGTVLVLDGNQIMDIVTPHRQGCDFVFTDKFKTINIYKFSKEFCNKYFKKLLDYYAYSTENAYYELVLGIIIYLQQHPVYAEIIETETWMEIDTPNDLAVAKFLFEPHDNQHILDHSFGGFWSYPILDFCFIRNMYFPTNAVISELKSNFVSCIHNYGSRQTILNLKLSYFLQCRPDYVLALNGASQIFPILGQYFKDRSVIIPTPTFGEYSKWFPDADQFFDTGTGLLPAECEHYDVVIVINPNNPTGTIFSSQMLYNWAQQHPNTFLIVDESFIEFSTQTSLIQLLEDRPLSNILIIKSLSKTLGIPGLRLGYVYTSNQQFYSTAQSVLPIWAMNSISEYFMEIIIRHRQALDLSYQKTINDREKFQIELKKLSIINHVYPSGGNFLMVKLNENLCANFEETLLQKHQIYVRRLHKLEKGYYWRLAVRTPEENQLCIEAIKTLSVSLL